MGFQETFNERVMPAQDRAFGITATLTQGSRTTEPFTVVQETKLYQVANDEGFVTAFESRDFMFARSDAAFDGEAITPREGDRLTITENATAAVYELLPIGQLPAVELMDGNYRWKVHSKRVE